jgi:hypothetical protein
VALTAPAFAADAVFGTFLADAIDADGNRVCTAHTLEDYGNGKFHFVAVEITKANARHRDGIFAFDGGDHGDGAGGTLAFIRIDAHRYIIVAKGSRRTTTTATLSDDQALLTEYTDGVDDGTAFHSVTIFKRSAGGCEPPQ